MNLSIDIQKVCASEDSPDEDSIKRWVSAAIRDERDECELSIRIVDEQESADFNQRYRGKSGATNVLSFPFDAVTPEPLPILGDLVICAPVLVREASEQDKTITAHWAHIVIHGVLHLLGYDHIEDQDAEQMESLETEIMLVLDFPPPYRILDESSDDPIEVTSN
ncbi:rRNA maturation RNase YbeY [SAR92 clade bacterium H455]|uniref:Endoribonuclease YbeY n=1 Tax=SAR92 clade bacterium H455 TaxID=2974818 RepID=A0ABY5TRK9_9GAMM|nr:rRNA maturation RNase YbeY [SAR92 clade bacterium H455]